MDGTDSVSERTEITVYIHTRRMYVRVRLSVSPVGEFDTYVWRAGWEEARGGKAAFLAA